MPLRSGTHGDDKGSLCLAKDPKVGCVSLDFFEVFPALETERLRLRQLRREDNRALFEIFRDHEVMRYYDVEPMTDPAQADGLIDEMHLRFTERQGIRWAIADKLGGDLLGTVGFNRIDLAASAAVVGYEIARTAWYRGFATEALRAVVRFGHDRIGVNRIEAAVMLENEASSRVLRKAGFEDEGVLPAHGHWKGRYHDLRMFSRLKAP